MKQLNQNSLGKGKGVCLAAKVSMERPENLCFCLDHPGQITLLEVCLPELRGQALPLTFQRGVICKCSYLKSALWEMSGCSFKHTLESTAGSEFENQAVKRLMKWNAQVEEKPAPLQHRGCFASSQKPQTDPAGCRLLSFLKRNMALQLLSTSLLHLFWLRLTHSTSINLQLTQVALSSGQ